MADCIHNSIICSTDFNFHQRKLTAGQDEPSIEKAPQTHHSHCLKPLCSLKTLTKGLRGDKGNTQITIRLFYRSSYWRLCGFACEWDCTGLSDRVYLTEFLFYFIAIQANLQPSCISFNLKANRNNRECLMWRGGRGELTSSLAF